MVKVVSKLSKWVNLSELSNEWVKFTRRVSEFVSGLSGRVIDIVSQISKWEEWVSEKSERIS